MDTHKKFSFEKKDIGTPLFPKFTTETVDGPKGLSSKFTLEGPVMDGVSIKNECSSDMNSYSAEASLDMSTLAGVDGLKLTVTADQAKKADIKVEYTSDLACVKVTTTPETLAAPAFEVGVSPIDGLHAGFAGSVSDPVSKVALGYSAGDIAAMLGLSGGFKKAEVRCLYTGVAGAKIAVKAEDLLGVPTVTAGATYKVDGT